MSDACSSREIVLHKTLNQFKENSVVCKFYNHSNTLGGMIFIIAGFNHTGSTV